MGAAVLGVRGLLPLCSVSSNPLARRPFPGARAPLPLPPGRPASCSRSRRAAMGNAFATAATAQNVDATGRQSWRIEKAGKVSDLKLVADEPLGAPGPGELRISVKAVGLNFADVFSCLGLYSATPPGAFVPGLEFSGVVEAVGSGKVDKVSVYGMELGPEAAKAAGEFTAKFKPGDRVMGVTRFGSYTTDIAVPAHFCRKIPDGWSFAQGAAGLVQGLTAFYGLSSLGAIKRGDTVLVQSAAGGCGMFALRICEALGATPVAVIGSPAKAQLLLDTFPSLSAERIIVRSGAREWEGQLRAALDSCGAPGYDIVLDAVSGDYFRGAYETMSRGGRYVVYGAADMTPHGNGVNWVKLAWKYITRPRLDPLEMMGENKSLMAFNLVWMFDRVELLSTLLDQLEGLKLSPPHVGRAYPFEQATEAIRDFQSGDTTGKVVLEVGRKEKA